MEDEQTDWRLSMGQEESLPPGTRLVRKPYRARSESWEHDHCTFCNAKFMDPGFSAEHAKAVAEDPEIQQEGYTTTAEFERGADYEWVCLRCHADFAEMFGWVSTDAV